MKGKGRVGGEGRGKGHTGTSFPPRRALICSCIKLFRNLSERNPYSMTDPFGCLGPQFYPPTGNLWIRRHFRFVDLPLCFRFLPATQEHVQSVIIVQNECTSVHSVYAQM